MLLFARVLAHARPSVMRPLALSIAAAIAISGCSNGVQRADAYEALADTLYNNKAYPAAIEALTNATKYDSNEPRRWLKLGRTWRALNNPALSAVSYQRALDLDPANPEALQNLAVLTVRAGRFADAKQYVDPLLVLNPNDLGGLLAQGAIAFFERRYGDADKTADQMITLAPDMAEGWILRARVMEARNDVRDAARLLEQRLALDPKNADLATQLLGFYTRSGDLQGIRRTALALEPLEPFDVPIQMEAARAHHALGQETEARRILATLLDRYPGSPDMNSAVADYWIATLPAGQATAKLVEMAKKVHGRARAQLALKLVDVGQAQAALDLLKSEASAPISAANGDIKAAYARALFAAGRFKEADAASMESAMFDQNDVALLVQARLALRDRKFDDAMINAQAVRDHDPDNDEAALLIARIFDERGNKVLARKAFGDAQAAMPDDIDVTRAHVAWLFDNALPEDAAQVAAQFARAHPRMGTALDLAKDTCMKAKTRDCQLAASNKRQPWNF